MKFPPPPSWLLGAGVFTNIHATRRAPSWQAFFFVFSAVSIWLSTSRTRRTVSFVLPERAMSFVRGQRTTSLGLYSTRRRFGTPDPAFAFSNIQGQHLIEGGVHSGQYGSHFFFNIWPRTLVYWAINEHPDFEHYWGNHYVDSCVTKHKYSHQCEDHISKWESDVFTLVTPFVTWPSLTYFFLAVPVMYIRHVCNSRNVERKCAYVHSAKLRADYCRLENGEGAFRLHCHASCIHRVAMVILY